MARRFLLLAALVSLLAMPRVVHADENATTSAPEGTGVLAPAARRHEPRVELERPRTTGGLPSAIVRRIILRNRLQVRYCYERGLTMRPTLRGAITVTFTIDTDGTVAHADIVRDTVGDPAVAACIVGAIRRWRYPTAARATLVRQGLRVAPAR